MTDFFTSDQHIGHQNIMKYEPNRSHIWESVEEMNFGMVERWNSVVAPDDVVYVIGDWAMGKLVDSLAYTPLFNGQKCLIIGNHDRPFRGKEKDKQNYLDAGFESVLWGPCEYVPPAKSGLPTVLLSHFPYAPAGEYDERFSEHHPKDKGMILLHGHVHSQWKFKAPRQINVGCDVWDYYPQTLESLLEHWEANDA